jgi:shikimate kinase
MSPAAAAGADTDRHIVLVGMMGAGKSSVGRALARRLDRTLYDSDEMVEQRHGRTVREIWRIDGEAAFRKLETEVLVEALAAPEPAIVAAAGGVVLSVDNRAALSTDAATVVWLVAGIDVLLERVRNGMHRPLLDDDPERTLSAMFEERAPLYREVADVIVSVDNRSVDDIARAVIRCCA